MLLVDGDLPICDTKLKGRQIDSPSVLRYALVRAPFMPAHLNVPIPTCQLRGRSYSMNGVQIKSKEDLGILVPHTFPILGER